MAKYLKYIFLFLCNSLFASKTYTINPKVKNVAIVQNTNFQNSTLKNATYVNGTLDSVYINNGQYCYTTLESPVVSGAEPPTPICTPIDTTKLPLVIRDGEGNQYVVNAGPPPTVTGPTSYLNVSTDNLAANDNLKVQFAAAPNQNFGFDSKQYPAFTEDYECIKLSNGKNYFVPNAWGFNLRKINGGIAAMDLIQKINNGTYTFNKQTDSIDIVAHSMGYAYSVGMIDKFIQEGFKLGRLYIIAPENPGGGSSDWTKFTEVYQYGSNLGEPNQDLMYLQDGVAPQSKVKDIERNYPNTKTARIFIPKSVTTKSFLGSHSVSNYGWIFNTIIPNNDGYVKPR